MLKTCSVRIFDTLRGIFMQIILSAKQYLGFKKPIYASLCTNGYRVKKMAIASN